MIDSTEVMSAIPIGWSGGCRGGSESACSASAPAPASTCPATAQQTRKSNVISKAESNLKNQTRTAEEDVQAANQKERGAGSESERTMMGE